MFYSCECGYIDCGICGPHIQKNKERENKRKIKKISNDIKMPFGKHKGESVKNLSASYCYWLLHYQNIKDKKLREALQENAQHYRSNYGFYNYDREDDELMLDCLPNFGD